MVWSLSQAWIPGAADAWNGPGWSLSVEAFFYCIFPVLGIALWRPRSAWSVAGVTVAVWGIALAAPALAVLGPLRDGAGVPASVWTPESCGVWVNLLKFNPLLHVPEFCTGVLTCRLYKIWRDKGSLLFDRGYWLYLPGLALEATAIALCGPTLYPFLHNGLLLPLHAVVVLGFALDGGWLARGLATQPLGLLGNASYSVYILQTPVKEWLSAISERVFSTKLSGLGGSAFYVVVLICFSIAVFKLVEEPANRFLKKKLARLVGKSPVRSAALERCAPEEVASA
jgi:peptidoglycan/LPS O-acetylase OafA/YrhL